MTSETLMLRVQLLLLLASSLLLMLHSETKNWLMSQNFTFCNLLFTISNTKLEAIKPYFVKVTILKKLEWQSMFMER